MTFISEVTSTSFMFCQTPRRTARTVFVCVALMSAGLTLGGCASFDLPFSQNKSSEPVALAQGAGAPETFRLANGMEVLVLPDHRAPVVTHMVWYRVGAADEVAGKSGIAHFLEHLMFKGTDKVAPGQFSKIVARNGGQDNAFTNYDYTGYFQVIAKDRLPLVMEMEADRMTHLKLTDKEVLPERDVVLEELRMRIENEPIAELQSKMNAALFGNSPYGRDVIGYKAEVEKLSTQDALDWYRRYYTPKNAVLIVAGDITGAELKPLADKYYGVIKDTAPTHVQDRPAVAWPQEPKRIVMHDERVDQASWLRFYPAPSAAELGPRAAAAMDVLAELLGGGTTSALYQSLVVRDRKLTSVQTWYEGDQIGSGSFAIYALPRVGGSMADAEKAIDAELAKFLVAPVAEDDLARARSTLAAGAIYARDRQQTMAQAYGTGLMTGLSPKDIFTWPDAIRGVTADDVREAAAHVLEARHAVTGELLPPDAKAKAAP
ncbi:MAG: M16 family metallopeptidase [Parvibaculaceae bacterium]